MSTVKCALCSVDFRKDWNIAWHNQYCTFIGNLTKKPNQAGSQKRHRLDASCGFYRPDTSCQQVVSSLLTSSSCIKSVHEHQTCCNLIFANLLQVGETTCIKPACSSQLATSLLTTCNRLVIIKPEQAMRPHPDIGLVIADLL